MTLLIVLLSIVLGTAGCCVTICCAGWWATVRPRLEHQERMFELAEKAKANAITIQERQALMLDRFKESA